MTLQEVDAKILKNLIYRRSNKEAGKRVGLTAEQYKQRKRILLDQSKEEIISPIITEETKVFENKFDITKGTGTMSRIMSYEPMSAKEIEIAFKLDLGIWKLSTYWNKAQSNGTFLVSANVTLLKKDDPIVVIEDMRNSIKEVFQDIVHTPLYFESQPSNGKSLMVYTSDKHVGAYVPENGLYRNDYSAVSFEQRMQLLLKEIIYLQTIYGVFENIYILDLGDSLDGMDAQTTRKGHYLPQNMSNKEAYRTYLKVHKEFFDDLLHAKVANNIIFTAITNDNHSGDFGYMSNSSVEIYLNAKYPQVKTKLVTKFIDHFPVGNHTFVICHGKDDEDMKHGLPLHINDKVTNFIGYYLDYHKLDHNKSNIHFIKGDLHQNTSEEAAKFRYRNVTSMFGSSKWAMHNFIPQSPGVSFDIVENNTNRIFEYKMKFNTNSTSSNDIYTRGNIPTDKQTDSRKDDWKHFKWIG